MKVHVLLLVCAVVRESHSDDSTPQPRFDPYKVDRYRNPEPKRGDLEEFKMWNDIYPGVDYMGFLFAGHAEFPWVVHIRDSYDQAGGKEAYSIGNLVSNRHVLTVCRAVTQYKCLEPPRAVCALEPDCPCKVDKTAAYIVQVPVDTLYIYWFPVNSWHESMVHTSAGEYLLAPYSVVQGRGAVLQTIVHPKCLWDVQMWYDMAVVIMKNPLPSLNMWVGVIQVPLKHRALEDDDRLRFIDDRRLICYVATVGYHMNGLPFRVNAINNYKVKYRVYPTEWQRCLQDTRFICRGNGCLSYRALNLDPTKVFRIECWQSRNKVGAICDRDRGAPVVCEGKVEGFVIRGALHDYCNPGIQLSFMMQRVVEDYPEFLEVLKFIPSVPLPDNPLNPFPDHRPRSGAKFSSHSLPSFNYPLLVSVIVFFSH